MVCRCHLYKLLCLGLEKADCGSLSVVRSEVEVSQHCSLWVPGATQSQRGKRVGGVSIEVRQGIILWHSRAMSSDGVGLPKQALQPRNAHCTPWQLREGEDGQQRCKSAPRGPTEPSTLAAMLQLGSTVCMFPEPRGYVGEWG